MASQKNNINGNVKKFFDSFEQTSPTSSSSSSPKEPMIESLHPTNPFLTPSLLTNASVDARSFFETLLDTESNLICLDDPPEPPKYTNPFLAGLVDVDGEEGQPLQPNLVHSNGKAGNTEGNNERPKNTQEANFVNETSFETVNECEIVNYFDKRQWKQKEFITFRVSNIYHLNKFWIVPRYRELEIFMEYLHEFYSKNGKDFRIRKPSVNMYCVAHYHDAYYRGIIVKFLPNDAFRLKVFVFDYGQIMSVHVDEVYHLPDVLYKTPQFAVRAAMAHVAPKRTQVWTSEVVKVFEEFSRGKVLVGQVVFVEDSNKSLHLNVTNMPNAAGKVKYFNESLMDEGYAKLNFDKTKPQHVQFDSNVQHLYIFPSFQMLETGAMPNTIAQFEYLMKNHPTAFNMVYGQYCTLK